MAKKVSPKIQAETEKYLALLGSSREQLTDEQWIILASRIKLQSRQKVSRIIFLLLGIILGCFAVWGYRITSEKIRLYVPDDTITVTQDGSELVLSLKPEEVENVIRWYIGFGSSIARCFYAAILCFICFGVIWYMGRERNRILQAFIPKAKQTGCGSDVSSQV